MKQLFPSLPMPASLQDVFKAFPSTIKPLLDYHDRLLRDDGALDVGTRELIAAYVSGLNACNFCMGAHQRYVQAFGLDPALVDALLTDIDTAPVDEGLKPLLHYVAALTQAPSRMTEAQAQAVYAAGWSEAALFEAIQICGLFNMMNRLVEGTGCDSVTLGPPADAAELAKRKSRRYADFGRDLGLE